MHIWLEMLWDFKNNKNATETTKKICSIYGQDVITETETKSETGFLNFVPVIGHWEMNTDQDSH